MEEKVVVKARKPKTDQLSRPLQLSICETADPLAGKLREALLSLDLNGMTPIDCLIKLQEWKKWIEE
jgi:DNA mismatch repair protein MutS